MTPTNELRLTALALRNLARDAKTLTPETLADVLGYHAAALSDVADGLAHRDAVLQRATQRLRTGAAG